MVAPRVGRGVVKPHPAPTQGAATPLSGSDTGLGGCVKRNRSHTQQHDKTNTTNNHSHTQQHDKNKNTITNNHKHEASRGLCQKINRSHTHAHDSSTHDSRIKPLTTRTPGAVRSDFHLAHESRSREADLVEALLQDGAGDRAVALRHLEARGVEVLLDQPRDGVRTVGGVGALEDTEAAFTLVYVYDTYVVYTTSTYMYLKHEGSRYFWTSREMVCEQ